jgi:hypothetical protein
MEGNGPILVECLDVVEKENFSHLSGIEPQLSHPLTVTIVTELFQFIT